MRHVYTTISFIYIARYTYTLAYLLPSLRIYRPRALADFDLGGFSPELANQSRLVGNANLCLMINVATASI